MSNTSSATLISLAMLKVNVDQGRDYLDYIRPFILQILVDQKPDPVTDAGIRDQLSVQFGLEIPERSVQLVLKRIAKRQPLKKEMGVYRITGILKDPGLLAEKSKAERHIHSVVNGLITFAKTTPRSTVTSDEAVTAILAFLAQSNISCLRAYLRGTTIPDIESQHENDIALVSQYVLSLQQGDPERFESFMIMAQGHMLANGLLCPDLQNAPKSYKGVTFYIDTPLLVRSLGVEGEPRKTATNNLLILLKNLGATVATFAHSRNELERVLRGAAEHINTYDGRGAIVIEARRNGTTKSDLVLLAGKIDEKLIEVGIELKPTPKYVETFQIGEAEFAQVLDDEVAYFNPRAKEYDINSVRSIYALRAGTSPSSIENSQAVLVTSNSGFSRAAWEYGQRYEESRDVSSVITDFSLANMAWLKAPMGAPSLPVSEILAFSYAALQPSKDLLNKYLVEIDRLEKQGTITERDHQLLRSSSVAQDELMRLTLGDEESLNQEMVTETLRRISNEIRKEESSRLTAEQEEHRKTRAKLDSELQERKRIKERIFWRSKHKARMCAWLVSGVIAVLLVVGFAAGLGLKVKSQLIGWTLAAGTAGLALLGLWNLIFGSNLKRLHELIQNWCLTWFIRKEAIAMGLDDYDSLKTSKTVTQ